MRAVRSLWRGNVPHAASFARPGLLVPVHVHAHHTVHELVGGDKTAAPPAGAVYFEGWDLLG